MRPSLKIADTATNGSAAIPNWPSTAHGVGSPSADLSIERISASFGDYVALDDISLELAAGDVLSLLGPSGSGKSTLLRIVAGVARPTRGRITIQGVEVEGAGVHVEPEQRRVGMVFQDYALFPHLTVRANVAFGVRGESRAAAAAIVDTLLDRVGLTRHADRYPHMLSGGERQRVALTRALAPKPRVLLMDEPFSSLDDRLRHRVRQETVDLLRETKTTTIIVTHDPREALSVGGRVALLERGRLLQCGSAEDLYARPATAFAARCFSDVNQIAGTCHRGQVQTPFGSFKALNLRDGEAALVCIRPEHLRIVRGPAGVRARVRSSEFLGEIDQITLDVEGLTVPVCVRVFGRARLASGDSVHLEVDSSAVVVVPDDDH